MATIRQSLGVPTEVAAGFAGKSKRWINYLEAGEVDVTTEALNGLALGFGVRPSILLGLEPLPHRFGEVRRREFLGALGGAAGLALLGADGGIQAGHEPPLERTLNLSLADAWNRAHNIDPRATEAEARVHLRLLSQLRPRSAPLLHSASHRLLGAALHRQGRYGLAMNEHELAYRDALAGTDPWSMAECRAWEAYSARARNRLSDSMAALESALHLVSGRPDPECTSLHARLLATAAQVAAAMGDETRASSYLYASEECLELLPPGVDFDRAAWLEASGFCALSGQRWASATHRLEQAARAPAPASHQIIRAIGLAQAHAGSRDRESSLAVADAVIPRLQKVRSSELTSCFLVFLRRDLRQAFGQDAQATAFADRAEAAVALHG